MPFYLLCRITCTEYTKYTPQFHCPSTYRCSNTQAIHTLSFIHCAIYISGSMSDFVLDVTHGYCKHGITLLFLWKPCFNTGSVLGESTYETCRKHRGGARQHATKSQGTLCLDWVLIYNFIHRQPVLDTASLWVNKRGSVWDGQDIKINSWHSQADPSRQCCCGIAEVRVYPAPGCCPEGSWQMALCGSVRKKQSERSSRCEVVWC